jgi:hypothetical protein
MGNCLFLEMVILAVQTVKGACVKKDGKVLITLFFPPRTDKTPNTIGRKWIVVIVKVSLMRTTPF